MTVHNQRHIVPLAVCKSRSQPTTILWRAKDCCWATLVHFTPHFSRRGHENNNLQLQSSKVPHESQKGLKPAFVKNCKGRRNQSSNQCCPSCHWHNSAGVPKPVVHLASHETRTFTDWFTKDRHFCAPLTWFKLNSAHVGLKVTNMGTTWTGSHGFSIMGPKWEAYKW